MRADTRLEPGTKCRIGLKLCEVVSVDYVPATPSGYVYVHTLRHYANKRRKYGHVWEIVQVKNPKLMQVNYSCISLD